MVQPQSVIATKGGAWARTMTAQMGALESIWVSNEHVFGDASVYTCAPCVAISKAGSTIEIQRYSGVGFVEHQPLQISEQQLCTRESWSSLVAVTMGVPETKITPSAIVGDMASATADFRDEYYGLVGKLIDDSEHTNPDESPPVLTTGLVDLGLDHWGTKATRIHKTRWEAPRVARKGITGDERLEKWVSARRVKKVVVATQTKVIEALVDANGEYVVLTPMISVMPNHADDLWKLGAAIGSPASSAYAMRHFGGAAMHADALKMSARQVLGLPLPADEQRWAEGAALFERVHTKGRKWKANPIGTQNEELKRLYESTLVQYRLKMCEAYRIEVDQQDELMDWWLGRLGLG